MQTDYERSVGVTTATQPVWLPGLRSHPFHFHRINNESLRYLCLFIFVPFLSISAIISLISASVGFKPTLRSSFPISEDETKPSWSVSSMSNSSLPSERTEQRSYIKEYKTLNDWNIIWNRIKSKYFVCVSFNRTLLLHCGQTSRHTSDKVIFVLLWINKYEVLFRKYKSNL